MSAEASYKRLNTQI